MPTPPWPHDSRSAVCAVSQSHQSQERRVGACFACSKSEVLQVRGAARRVLVPLVDRIGSSILQRAA